jgi:hypothetical protein
MIQPESLVAEEEEEYNLLYKITGMKLIKDKNYLAKCTNPSFLTSF